MPNYKKYNQNNNSKGERSFKYLLCRVFGFSWKRSREMRDYTLKRITRLINMTCYNENNKAKNIDE